MRLIRHRDTDKPRGCFLTLGDAEGLQRALSRNNELLRGRPMRVDVAEARQERSSGACRARLRCALRRCGRCGAHGCANCWHPRARRAPGFGSSRGGFADRGGYGGDRGGYGDRGGDRYAFSGGGYQEPMSRGSGGPPDTFDVRARCAVAYTAAAARS